MRLRHSKRVEGNINALVAPDDMLVPITIDDFVIGGPAELKG